MKKNYLFLLLAGIAVAFTACEKERNDDAIKNITLNVTINAGELYSLDLSPYGDADDKARIATQAGNYSISELTKSGAKDIYQYQKNGNPKFGGNGTDQVVLNISENRNTGGRGNCNQNGRRPHNKETNITINFTIL
jgi:hypothetical protein